LHGLKSFEHTITRLPDRVTKLTIWHITGEPGMSNRQKAEMNKSVQSYEPEPFKYYLLFLP
jgi:hypothetical protein